jgi:hypothetical protein
MGRQDAERQGGRRPVDEGRRVLGAELEIRIEARRRDRLPGRQAAPAIGDLGLREAADGGITG